MAKTLTNQSIISVVVNVPKMLKIGEEFEIVSARLVSDKEYKRLTVKYDNSGDFMLLSCEIFNLQE